MQKERRRIDRKEIIKALRCINAVDIQRDCANCKYRLLEQVEENIPIKDDVEIDGVQYWESCDYDQICMDAENALEDVETGWHIMKEKPEDVPGKDVKRYATICEGRKVIAWKEL